MELETESRGSLMTLRSGHVPKMLGTFQLDDHNVEEWSDMTQPGLQHRARREVGKWIDPGKNANIEYQKREDVKKSVTGHENERTEVIQGSAPDSNFQIVRSERQFQNNDSSSGTQVSSMTSSYQMSSSRGIRSTAKTTSNKTSTRTISVSNTGASAALRHSEDFENLKMAFTPLDTSTQRERITVSRSGTMMGVRRPPTRRHTNTPTATVEPKMTNQVEEVLETPYTVEENDEEVYLSGSPTSMNNNNTSISTTGIKNLSPKIRVGFPIEIQLELQNKLRLGQETFGGTFTQVKPEEAADAFVNPRKNSFNGITKETSSSLSALFKNRRNSVSNASSSGNFTRSTSTFLPLSNSNSSPCLVQKDSTNQNVPSVESHSILGSNSSINTGNSTLTLLSKGPRFQGVSGSRSSNPRSWALVNGQANIRGGNDSSKPNLTRDIRVDNLDLEDSQKSKNNFLNDGARRSSPVLHLTKDFNRTTHSVLSYKGSIAEDFAGYGHEDPPDTQKTWKTSEGRSSPNSREFLGILRETPDILNQISFKNFNSNAATEKINNCDGYYSRVLSTSDCSSKSNQSRLPNPFLEQEDDNVSTNENQHKGPTFHLDFNFNFNREDQSFGLGPTKVSQTWISAGDPGKPSRTARDQHVTTSISATNEPSTYHQKALRKVEFCKTEVHFTPDSGKFTIVESDENKPSTVHLYRRRRRGEKRSGEFMKLLDRGSVHDEEPQEGESYLETIVQKFETKELKPNDIEEKPSRTFQRSFPGPLAEPKRLHMEQHNSRVIRGSHTQDLGSEGFIINKAPEEPTISKQIVPSNYDELQIQRYIKQLQSPGLTLDQEEDSLETTLLESRVEGPVPEDHIHSRFDNILYEHGSFVPRATRKSLIEMNNHRDGRRRVEGAWGGSDNSSTTSNYSLPHSDSTGRLETQRNSRLKAMEARTMYSSLKQTQNRSKDTEVDSSSANLLWGQMTSTDKRPFSKIYETSPKTQTFNNLSYEYNGIPKPHISSIPSPVMPIENTVESILPYLDQRKGNYELRQEVPAKTDKELNPAFLFPKPPTPVYPIHNSPFHLGDGSTKSGVPTGDPNKDKDEEGPQRKSDLYEFRQTGTNLLIPSIYLDTVESEQEPFTFTPEPVLGKDHTWKGPAHFESNENPGTLKSSITVARSMTFPKSTRPEQPEWVSKAKSRESRFTDWNFIGRRYSQDRTSKPEAPWLSEIKFKHVESPSEDLKSLARTHPVYPWHQDDSGKLINGQLEGPSLRIPKNSRNSTDVPPPDGPSGSFSNRHSFSGPISFNPSNKSIVDLNRDSDSILVDLEQIKAHSYEVMSTKSTEESPSIPLSSGIVDEEINPRIVEKSSVRASNREKMVSKIPSLSLDNQIIGKGLGRSQSQYTSAQGNERSRLKRSPSNKSHIATPTSSIAYSPIESSTKDTQKVKEAHRAPRPPERVSSLLKTNLSITSGSLSKGTTKDKSGQDKKRTPLAPKINMNSISSNSANFDSSISTGSSTPIHRHPTIKISKLPVRTPPSKSSEVDGQTGSRPSKVKVKGKSSGSLISEAKRIYKSKLGESAKFLATSNKSYLTAPSSEVPSGRSVKSSGSMDMKPAGRKTVTMSIPKKS